MVSSLENQAFDTQIIKKCIFFDKRDGKLAANAADTL
jgi:hypothetical protein